MSARGPLLLLYVAPAADVRRHAIAAALAALAIRSDARFECYYDQRRLGRHFGGGEPAAAPVGMSGGSLFEGGRHAEHVLRLGHHFRLIVVADRESPLQPALDAAGSEVLEHSNTPGDIYRAVLERLGVPAPLRALIVDGQPQGPHGVVTAPYTAPAFLAGTPALGLDVTATSSDRAAVEALGVNQFDALWVDAGRGTCFPGGFDVTVGAVGTADYGDVTPTIASSFTGWARGAFLGDPELVAAQMGRIAARRLVPLYSRPQVQAIRLIPELAPAGTDPVFGRQYDDRDFIELAHHGRSLQVVDPCPPFESARVTRVVRHPAVVVEPDDAQLERWADRGTVLVTLCVWAGMVRELDALGRIIDVVSLTGARGGLVVTAETAEHGAPLHLLGVPPERGGVAGRLELLLGSTGRGVAAEELLDRAALTAALREAMTALDERVGPELMPRGWWPLLDARFETVRPPLLGRRGRRPVVYFTPRRDQTEAPGSLGGGTKPALDLRAIVGGAVRRLGLDGFVAERRPFDSVRPGAFDPTVAAAVRAAGLSFMWTKADFGVPRAVVLDDAFIVLPFTAGNWDGWSPFYTVGSVRDVVAAERRLLRAGKPGWLASTVDSPLFAMSGEVWSAGARLHEVMDLVARGGATGRLVNVTPSVVARYARLLHEREAAGVAS